MMNWVNYPDNRLPRVSPESVGIPSAAVRKFMEAIRFRSVSLHSFLLMRHGKVAAECYYAPYRKDSRHRVYSVSKSFTSAAAGIAIGQGKLHLSDRAADFFPEELDGPLHPFTAAMTVEDLLTMRTVHKGSTDTSKGRWVHSFLNTPPSHPSGTTFAYDTTGTHMVCAILQKITGKTVHEYLQETMFDKVGIGPITWEKCDQGICLGGSGIRCTTEDMARFGQLYLQDGVWNGERIFPEGWASASLAAQADNSCGNFALDGSHGYGYFFWRTRYGGACAFGMGGQLIVMLPRQELVFACTANVMERKDGQQLILDCLWETLYDCLSDTPLPEAPEELALLQKETGRAVTWLPGQLHSPWEAIGGKPIHLDAGFEGITDLELDFRDNCGALKLTRHGKECVFPFGLGYYVPFFDPFTGLEACCGASFVQEDLLVIRTEFPDHVQRYEFHCAFRKDRITVQLRSIGGLRDGVERFNGYLGAML